MYSEGFNWVFNPSFVRFSKKKQKTLAVESIYIIVYKEISNIFSVKTFEYINKMKQEFWTWLYPVFRFLFWKCM